MMAAAEESLLLDAASLGGESSDAWRDASKKVFGMQHVQGWLLCLLYY